MVDIVKGLEHLFQHPLDFAHAGSGIKLRYYQQSATEAIIDSVLQVRGLSFVVIFPRQSGKNELQAQIETFLLSALQLMDAEIVKVSPTWKPQTLNAMRRLERVVSRNITTRGSWRKESGYIYRVGRARIFFLSGGPTANVVGATASTLLECDEAQDVTIENWDKDFAPMAASTNATRVFWGTVWTSKTLLAREMRAALEAEKKDHVRRVFMMNADNVRSEVPAYGIYIDEQVSKLGRQHPFVKTQYFSEEIDAEGGMFNTARRALMQGCHPARSAPKPGHIYAMLLDVAGIDENATDSSMIDEGDIKNAGRDSTALTVVEVDLSSLEDELIKAPTYYVMYRTQWQGIKHTTLYGQIKALAEHWKVKYPIADATGVGAGLVSFLDKALPKVVIPFLFTSKSKSELGWSFISVIETGRYKEYLVPPTPDPSLKGGEFQEDFWKQVENCQMAILDGPQKLMRWGVPDGSRDPQSGELMHDDLLISAALCAELDKQVWGRAESLIVAARDILSDMKEVY